MTAYRNGRGEIEAALCSDCGCLMLLGQAIEGRPHCRRPGCRYQPAAWRWAAAGLGNGLAWPCRPVRCSGVTVGKD